MRSRSPSTKPTNDETARVGGRVRQHTCLPKTTELIDDGIQTGHRYD